MHKCPLCASTEAHRFPIAYEFRGKKFRADRCAACNFVHLEPRPTPEDIAALYSDEYFLYDGAECGAHSPTDYETAAQKGSVKFPAILGKIQERRPEGSFFEVGCGMGYFLDFARSKGYHVSGIEYAALGVGKCRSLFGLDVEQSSLEDYDPRGKTFDVVFMGDVLEHLVEPLAMARKCRTLLKPGGVLAVEVPSMFNSMVGRLAVRILTATGKTKNMPMPPYHVNEFVPATLSALLRKAGLEEVSIVQRIKKPSTITLRGAWYERWGKFGLQYPNYLITSSFGVFGDRLLGLGQAPQDASGDARG